MISVERRVARAPDRQRYRTAQSLQTPSFLGAFRRRSLPDLDRIGASRIHRGGGNVSESNPIRVFVTHGFQESENYLRSFEFLESVDRFYYLNVSRPDAAVEGGAEGIKEELIAQIKLAEAAFVLPDLFERQPDLVKFMMDAADINDVPMIVIRPFGHVTETPPELIARTREHIEWNSREMVDALKRQARNEDTQRWEAVDFPGWDETGKIDMDKE